MEINTTNDGEIRITVDDNKMKAYVEITFTPGCGKECSLEDIKMALADNHVVYGIDESRLKEVIQEQNWAQRILIAQGTAAINATDARLIYKFPTIMERITPKVDDKGNVDYKNLGLIYNVKAGEVLMERIPPQEGRSGTDVAGKQIMPAKARDLRLPQGRNTVTDKAEKILLAGIDGHVSIRDNLVTVEPVLELNGDVDYSSGNINFTGNVLINGNISSGFAVSVGGDLEVRGFIEGAQVEANGSIMVHGGITGGIKTVIKAGEDISARFIENSCLEAGRNIFIREAILQSYIKAGGVVKVNDKRATIVGGVIKATNEVEAKTIGSHLATQTIIEIGINPRYRDEYQQLFKDRKLKNNVLEELNHNVQVFQRGGINLESLSDRRRLALIKTLDELKKVRHEVDAINERIAYLESQFQKVQAARVRALEVIYPGVRITIGQVNYVVNDMLRYAQFELDQGEVKLTSLS